MKKLKVIILSASIITSLLTINVLSAFGMTPTWDNDAKFTRGVGNACYWISPSASSYNGLVVSAAAGWVQTGWNNPIYMTEVSSNIGTHIDVFQKTTSQDSTLSSNTAAYVSYWNNSSELVAPRGYGPSVNYFYTEITLNQNLFPAEYRKSILIHEMGHAFGLRHSDSKYSIMYPYYNSVLVNTVQKVDNDTINYLY